MQLRTAGQAGFRRRGLLDDLSADRSGQRDLEEEWRDVGARKRAGVGA